MRTHIIIGASAAGMGVLNQLRTLDPESNILCFAKETAWPYNTCFLADYLSGSREREQLFLKPQEFFEKQRIQLMLGCEVIKIDSTLKMILLKDGRAFSYDTLFLGLGARARTLSIPGSDDCKEIFYFHTYDDTLKIKQFISNNYVEHALVIGAGLSGLEVADSLNKNGIRVTIVEQSVQVLPHHVDKRGSQLICKIAQSHNTSIMTNVRVARIITQNGKLRTIDLSTGEQIQAQMVVIAIGSQPNSELACDAGLELLGGALVTNEYMQTSDSSIFAGGDVAVVHERMSGQLIRNGAWPDAMHQGLIAAHSMVGIKKQYPGAVNIISSAFFGVHFFSCGPVTHQEHGYKIVVQEGEDYYHALLIHNKILQGFLLIGATQKAAEYRKLFLTQTPVDF